MTFAVRYYTQTGNTPRLAEAIAKELGVEALPISTPINEKVDVLLLGNLYYAFTIAPEVGTFVSVKLKGRMIQLYRMPSSSRAYPMAIEKKAAFYQTVFDTLR